jgi:hypothetical protein
LAEKIKPLILVSCQNPFADSSKISEKGLRLIQGIQDLIYCMYSLYTKLEKIFSEMKLRGLIPNFYIHVSVSDLYIPTIGPSKEEKI